MSNHKRRLTREELAQRKLRTLYRLCIAVWLVFLIVAMITYRPNESASETPSKPETTVVIERPPLPTIRIEPVVGEQEEEEVSPVRDDIPMDAETQELLYRACGETGIQHELALAVIWQETRFQNIVGDSGNSIGYMQIQQKWHEGRMLRLGVTSLKDPYGNFLVGCDYLAELLAKDRGIEWALMAYNGGPSYANKMAKAETVSKYAQSVLNYMNTLKMEEI